MTIAGTRSDRALQRHQYWARRESEVRFLLAKFPEKSLPAARLMFEAERHRLRAAWWDLVAATWALFGR